MTPISSDNERLAELFRAHASQVLAYALRRGLAQDEAEDVVGDTFVVAARHLQDIPHDSLVWLLGVARRITVTHHRTSRRSEALRERLAYTALRPTSLEQDPVVDTAVARSRHRSLGDALSHLSDNDREALLLVAWDGLDTRRAAQVAGCGYATFAVRVHRARKRLMEEFHASGH